jgi:hypothetical protein
MRTWIQTAEETTTLYSPIGLRLIDDLTGKTPLERIDVLLDIQDAQGTWRATGISPVLTASGVVTYPGLERHANPSGLGARKYRVRLNSPSQFYVPLYRRNADGIVADAYPYNDTHPPAVVKQMPDDTILTPAPNYPFQDHIPVLHGVIVDPTGRPVPDAVVTQGLKERVLTDSRGTFSLPLRWIKPNINFVVDAANERNGQTGTAPNLRLPNALKTIVKIPIN